jgi:hypothetical protein
MFGKDDEDTAETRVQARQARRMTRSKTLSRESRVRFNMPFVIVPSTTFHEIVVAFIN